jgi:class 3 adenylate cyclase
MSDSGASLESDRRLVTVMFADISGCSAMPEKMDPEWKSRRW